MKVSSKRVDSSTGEVRPVIRSAYSGRVRVAVDAAGKDRTKQQFKDECDINVIMKRYEATGVLPGMERAAGARYMDCSGVDYQGAMLVVASAKSAFADLPARLRDRFDNDPAKLMEFLDDGRNLEEARELGLARPAEKEATPLAVRVVEPPVSDPEQSSKVSGPPGPTANAAGREVKAKS